MKQTALPQQTASLEESKKTVPSVAELSSLLKERIYSLFKSANALWERIDPDLKVKDEEDGVKSLEGKKVRKSRLKITKSAFSKAVERLDKPGKKSEDMTFGINGNPILLMNVFKILGIKGFSDLIDYPFKDPDLIDKAVRIEDSINKLQDQLDTMNENIEVYCGRGSRFTQEELGNAIIDLTTRLLDIIEKKEDKNIDTSYYEEILNKDFTGSKNTFNNFEQGNDPWTWQKNYIKMQLHKMKQQQIQEKYNSFFQKARYSDVLLGGFINTVSDPQYKQELLLQNILIEYTIYCSRDSHLRQYCRTLETITQDNTFVNSKEYILTPLYILYLYVQIIRWYLKRLDNEKMMDEEIINYISLFSKNKVVKGKPHKIETIKEYLLKETDSIYNLIQKILKFFEKDGAPTPPRPKYSTYIGFLKEIIIIYRGIFTNEIAMKESIFDKKVIGKQGIQNIHQLKRYCIKLDRIDIFRLTRENVDQFQHYINDLSDYLKETKRDLEI